MKLDEYAELYGKQERPAEEAETMKAVASSERTKEAEALQVEDLKTSIMQQLEIGMEPQFALSTALKCIGLLTNDTDWTEKGEGYLNTVYEGLEEQSFLVDNAAVAASRLKCQTASYNDKLRKAIVRQINGYQKVFQELSAVLDSLDAIELEAARQQD